MNKREGIIMKKLFALILALLTMTSTACAETLRLYDISPSDDFRAAHPDVEIITNHDENLRFFFSGMELNNALLTGGFAWDAFETPSPYTDLQLLYKKGYMLDLSGSEVIREVISRLHPDIAALCMYDGRIYGVPTYITYAEYPTTVWPEMWLEAGYTQEDVPQTFGEYLDFIDAWLDRRENDSNLTLNVFAQFQPFTYDIHSYPRWLVDALLDSYIGQTLYAGKTLRFDDPDLIPLLEKARAVGERIFIYEPTKTDDNSNYGLFGGALEELEYSQLAEWQVDLRIHEDQPTILQFWLNVAGVYAGVENPALAIAAVEDYVQEALHEAVYDRRRAHVELLFTDGQPVRNAVYERVQRLSQNYIDMCEHKLIGDETPYTEYIDMTELDTYWGNISRFAEELKTMTEQDIRDRIIEKQEEMAQYQRDHEYVLSPENLTAWKQYAQHLYFPGPNVFTTDEGYENFKSLKSQFVDGLIDARQLVSELDRIAWMMEMENQ